MNLKYRPDIDGLRAVAVVVALLFHAHIPPFRGGFIGVDIFFVLSGYLITSILYNDMMKGEFSLVDFYDRRIRRIFPALFVVLPVTTLIAAVLLMPRQMVLFAQSIIPSALFYANIHFQGLMNYFGPQADETPLLHLWSLAVEEQYYIFFPLLMFAFLKTGGRIVLGPRRMAILGFLFIAIVSGVYAELSARTQPTASFFLLQSRAWELLVGALLALVHMPKVSDKTAGWIGVAGLLAIVVPVFAYSHDMIFPGLSAAPIVFGTAAVIYAGTLNPAGYANFLLSRPKVVYVGRISYALYLWHWPLLVFGKTYMGRALTYFEAGGVLIVAFIFASLSLKYVETPLRHAGSLGGKRRARFAAGIMAMAMTLAVGVLFERLGGGFYPISPLGARAEAAMEDRSPFSRSCNNSPTHFSPATLHPASACSVGPGAAKGEYDVVVWGDSHAGASFIGIAEQVAALGHTARLQTMAGCPPLIGGQVHRDGVPNWTCAAFNAEVLEEIRRTKPKVAVLVSRWALWTTKAGPAFTLTSDEVPGGGVRSKEVSQKVLPHMLDRTLKELSGLGIHVVLIGQGPEFIRSPGRCVAEKEFYNRKLGNCLEVPTGAAEKVIGIGNEMITKAAATYPGASTFLLSDVFCRNGTCRAGEGERFYYVDADHLSAAGAQQLSEDPALRAALVKALGGGPSAALAK
ncbi:acyltransferase family protein [Xanthobacter aminoxidans]|jgi:peptidoglycan/LPS O-acetylase OafA/YrhL|uniref:acyltransferase family protein n=1 Tax=Xanthobacter aminoxidans TaxID=186280 RepID=UPI003728A191